LIFQPPSRLADDMPFAFAGDVSPVYFFFFAKINRVVRPLKKKITKPRRTGLVLNAHPRAWFYFSFDPLYIYIIKYKFKRKILCNPFDFIT